MIICGTNNLQVDNRAGVNKDSKTVPFDLRKLLHSAGSVPEP